MGHVISIDVLLQEFEDKITEAKEIYDTLKTLKKYAAGQGQDFEMPDLQKIFEGEGMKISDKATVSIRSDEFFGLSNTEAAERYLRKIGHAMPLTDIFEALSTGGITFTGDGKKNLYTQLVRATRKFSKIGSGSNITFGLNEWYPARRKKNDTKEDSSAAGRANEEEAETSQASSIEEPVEEREEQS